MSPNHGTTSRHAFWRGAYGATLSLLPRKLREKHGAAMMALYTRELERSAAHGRGAVWRAAVVGLADLLGRGVYERVVEERAALDAPNRQVLHQLGWAFVASFVALTTLMLFTYMWRAAPGRSVRELPIGTTLETIVYSIPFIAALTIPMSVFVSVLFAGTRASSESATRPGKPAPIARGGRLRLAPLMGVASVVMLFGFAWNAEVVPRSNARLLALYTGKPTVTPSDRSMTLTELRAASRRLEKHSDLATDSRVRETAVSYSVEIHKKFAIAAACVVFALLAAGTARRVPHAGLGLQLLASVLVFTGHYLGLTVGESLADQYALAPAPAMWGANVVTLVVALLALRKRAAPEPMSTPTLS